PGEIYLDGSKSHITGERNLWFGAGAGPSQTLNNIGADPGFLNHASFDFHLAAASPARDAGLTVVPLAGGKPADRDGVPRPPGKACALGAYQVVERHQ